ncbi:MAG: sensor domain-containing diguanylate cyclase [Candidatus Omnitrophica bacterium]|nr:sensor domain-containing diguanylate cyclase [Candidatus Omnitrophota bacterium]
MLYEIGIAMRSTLRLDEILYIILTSVTANEGLGFNRAMLFLVNEKKNQLEGRMGIGPDSGENAHEIWKYIENTQKTMDQLISSYADFDRRTDSKKLLSSNDPVISLFNMEYFVTVPLLAKNRVVGIMLVDNFFSKNKITESDIWKLTMFANQAGLAIENSQEFEKTLILSYTDHLTNLWNYGYFQHQLREEIKRASRFNRQLSLLMIDIDFFKKFNDTYGHPAGDKLLKQLAEIFQNSSREVDLVARYGGEEFVIILPETFKEKAYSSAERIRSFAAAFPFQTPESDTPKHATISIGVSSFPQDSSTAEGLISAADKALYAAKNIGRNRVCMFSKELI